MRQINYLTNQAGALPKAHFSVSLGCEGHTNDSELLIFILLVATVSDIIFGEPKADFFFLACNRLYWRRCNMAPAPPLVSVAAHSSLPYRLPKFSMFSRGLQVQSKCSTFCLCDGCGCTSIMSSIIIIPLDCACFCLCAMLHCCYFALLCIVYFCFCIATLTIE